MGIYILFCNCARSNIRNSNEIFSYSLKYIIQKSLKCHNLLRIFLNLKVFTAYIYLVLLSCLLEIKLFIITLSVTVIIFYLFMLNSMHRELITPDRQRKSEESAKYLTHKKPYEIFQIYL